MLRTSAAVLGLWLALGAAGRAEELLAGDVRDARGAAVAGARVAALDAQARVLAQGQTGADGTFALSADRTPVWVRIACDYCRPLTVRVRAGEPVVAIVQRYGALLSAGPTAQDLLVLPYARVEDALALRPFSVLRPQGTVARALYPALSDRGLARTALVLDDAAPTYDQRRDATLLGMVPAAGAGVTFVPPVEAYRYGVYAGGGTYVVSRAADPFVSVETGLESGGAVSVGTDRAGMTLATVAEPGESRSRAVASTSLDAGGGALQAQVALSGAGDAGPNAVRENERSLSLEYAKTFERVRLQFTAATASGASSVAGIPGLSGHFADTQYRLGAQSRVGGVDLGAGVAHIESDAFAAGTGGLYDEDTAFVDAHAGGATRVDAALGATSLHQGGAGGRGAFTPSLALTQRAGEFDLYAAVSRAILPAASTYDPYRLTTLDEAGIRYGDRARVRVDAEFYRRTGEGMNPLAGTGASLTYQVGPVTTLRYWALRVFGDVPDTSGKVVLAQPYVSGEVLWLTQISGAVRYDLLYRRTASLGQQRALDGDLVFPLGRRLDATLRSERRSEGRRTSFGLVIQP